MYLDDEPDDGPQHYVLMTGFHQPSLISALDSVGVHVSNIIRLKSDRSHKSDVAQEEERTIVFEEPGQFLHLFNKTFRLNTPSILLKISSFSV